MKKPWMITAVLGVLAAATLAFVQQEGGQEAEAGAQEAQADTTIQPIAFPHDIHAGTYGMDCQYCHFSAEYSVDAGIPPVQTCWGCHQAIPGANNPQEVAKIQGYVQRGEPIPWVRVYKISDHAHFPHLRHVGVAGIECQTCHGPVETMGAIEEQDPAWGGDNMGWCISCHVEEGASRDCASCHY